MGQSKKGIMTRNYNNQRRDGSRPSSRSSSTNRPGEGRSQYTPRAARPRPNRESLDQAWESGAAPKHADYRSRTPQRQSSQQNRHNSQSSEHSPNHNSSRPFDNRQDHAQGSNRSSSHSSSRPFGNRQDHAQGSNRSSRSTLLIMARAPLTQRDAPTMTSPTVDNEAMPVALIKKVPIPVSVITGTTSSVLNTATALPSKAPSNAARSVLTAGLTSFNEVNAFHATINRSVVPHNLILATHAGKANKQRIVTTRSATDHRTVMSTLLIKKLNLKETTSVLTMPTISLK